MPLTQPLISYDQWQSGTALGEMVGKRENGWKKGRKCRSLTDYKSTPSEKRRVDRWEVKEERERGTRRS